MPVHAASLGPLEKRRSKDPFVNVACPVLRDSLREVAAELVPNGAPGSEDEALINEDLARLALRLDGAGAGTVLRVGSPNQGGLDARAEVHMLVALRRSLLEQWRRKSMAVDPDRMLELLYAIDGLVEEHSPRATGDLRARLAEPDAFRLVAEIAHDIRSPLTSILFLSEAMRNGHSGSHTDLQRSQLGLIYSAALGLTGVANDLMTAAQDQASGKFEEALKVLGRAETKLPDRPYFHRASMDVYRRWARSLFEQGKPDAAFAIFARAKSRHGTVPEVLAAEADAVNDQGLALLKQGRAEEALAVFDRGLAVQPDAKLLRTNRRKAAEQRATADPARSTDGSAGSRSI